MIKCIEHAVKIGYFWYVQSGDRFAVLNDKGYFTMQFVNHIPK